MREKLLLFLLCFIAGFGFCSASKAESIIPKVRTEKSVAYDDVEYTEVSINDFYDSTCGVKVKSDGLTFIYFIGLEDSAEIALENVDTGKEAISSSDDYGIYRVCACVTKAGSYALHIKFNSVGSIRVGAYTLPAAVSLAGKSKTFYCTADGGQEIVLKLSLKKARSVSIKLTNETWGLSENRVYSL